MLDINLLRNDPEKVRENIRKKFQDEKLPMVDEVIRMDREYRDAQQQADSLRNRRKTLSKEIGGLMGRKKKAEAAGDAGELAALTARAEELKGEVAPAGGRVAAPWSSGCPAIPAAAAMS